MGPLMNSNSVLFSSLTWLVGGGSFFAMVIVMIGMKMRERQIDKNFLSIRTQAAHCHVSSEYSSLLNLSYTPCLDTIFWTKKYSFASFWVQIREVFGSLHTNFKPILLWEIFLFVFLPCKKISWNRRNSGKTDFRGPKYIPQVRVNILTFPDPPCRFLFQMACTGLLHIELHVLFLTCTYGGYFRPSKVSFGAILA